MNLWQKTIEGEIFLVDKPYEWSSFDVVKNIKSLFWRTDKTKLKIGHAGTLDPLATGLLVICTGKKTKIIDRFLNDDKAYSGTICLGATRPSFDRETEIDAHFDTSAISEQMIRNMAASFLGEQEQYPPVFSAVKIDGKRAYEKARKGQDVQVRPRTVHISRFDITGIEGNLVHFYVKCSKGTYIRSLASDFGKRLNSGAYLHDLRRERSGDFDVKNAYTMNDLMQLLRDSYTKTQTIPES
ncbi:MAG: tRNA pseudouridine(55) synthase TruB [Bacteroidia bacterium]|nr:tRNA pseudouridine(55) synthase TruB [Bacteroidia bacterium]